MVFPVRNPSLLFLFGIYVKTFTQVRGRNRSCRQSLPVPSACRNQVVSGMREPTCVLIGQGNTGEGKWPSGVMGTGAGCSPITNPLTGGARVALPDRGTRKERPCRPRTTTLRISTLFPQEPWSVPLGYWWLPSLSPIADWNGFFLRFRNFPHFMSTSIFQGKSEQDSVRQGMQIITPRYI